MINSKTVAVLAVLGVAAGAMFLTPRSSQAEVVWPPRAGQPFPDVQLTENFPPETNPAATRVYERACHWEPSGSMT